MSITTPKLGDRSRAVLKKAQEIGLEREGTKLLLLIAAYRDAGEASPPVQQLGERMGYTGDSVHKRRIRAQQIDRVLRRLIEARMIYVHWQATDEGRNIYLLTGIGEKITPRPSQKPRPPKKPKGPAEPPPNPNLVPARYGASIR